MRAVALAVQRSAGNPESPRQSTRDEHKHVCILLFLHIRQAEDDDEERDYLSFLKTSGQVPAEHPPEEDFEEFLETTNQLTPKALRAAEQEYKASEEAEEAEDFTKFLSETGQVRFPAPAADSIETVLSSAEQDILRLRQELGAQCDASTARRTP